MPKKSKKQPLAGPGIRIDGSEPNTLITELHSGVLMVDTGRTARVDDLIEYERNAKIHTPEHNKILFNRISYLQEKASNLKKTLDKNPAMGYSVSVARRWAMR